MDAVMHVINDLLVAGTGGLLLFIGAICHMMLSHK
jgi:hypothetical protein